MAVDDGKRTVTTGPTVVQGPRIAEPAYDTQAIEHSTIRWRAIFAGAFVALLTYLILMSLGLAVAGGNLQGAIQGDDSVQGLGIGTGIWTVLSVLISLFVGSYAGGRVSGLVPIRVGRIEGAVVAALFFGFVFMQVGSIVGTLGRGLGSTVSAIGGAAGDVSGNPQVQSIVDEAIGDLELRSAPETVIQGLVTRLIRGDEQGAIRYLSRQTGITEAEARQRLDTIRQDVQQAATDAGTAAARALRAVGWTLFGALFLGTLVSMLGGGLGAAANLRTPMSRSDRKAIDRHRAA